MDRLLIFVPPVYLYPLDLLKARPHFDPILKCSDIRATNMSISSETSPTPLPAVNTIQLAFGFH